MGKKLSEHNNTPKHRYLTPRTYSPVILRGKYGHPGQIPTKEISMVLDSEFIA